MNPNDETLKALREAVKISPQNPPLRQHLADTLLACGMAEEAEKEFREALKLWPKQLSFQVGLAQAFHQQGKEEEAITLLESLSQAPDLPAKARVLYARLLLKSGEQELAQEEYRKAIEADRSLADADLGERLKVVPEKRKLKVNEEWAPEEEGEFRSAEEKAALEKPAISFKDVGGMEELKEEIRMKIIYPMTHSEMFKAYGKSMGGGLLLYGPPGCGKTYLARATAGEIQANFMSVGIHDVLNMWIGESEKSIHHLFDMARKHTPCVLFFDEVDALGAKRADMKASGARHMVNQFLMEMDGTEHSNEGILVMAATNAPWDVDSAFRRPGRFDRVLFVTPPDAPARAAVLRLMGRGKPLEEVDFEAVAKKTEKFSGADLKALVDTAVEEKLKEAMKEGKLKPLSTKDLLKAVEKVRPSTAEWFSTAKNYAQYSNQDGTYDDILKYLKLLK